MVSDVNRDETIWTSDFIKLTAAHLFGALGYASMLLLPLYLSSLGGSRSDIGFIMSFANIIGLLTRPLVGWSLDEIGRKASLVFGCVITVISMVLIYWVKEIDSIIYISRFLFGLGEGFLFTGYFAYAADLLPVSRRTEGLALFGVAGLVPLLVNPIADLTGFQGANLGHFIVYIAALVSISAILILMIKHKNTISDSVDHVAQQNLDPHDLHTDIVKDSADTVQPNKISNRPLSRWQTLSQAHLRPVWLATFIFAGSVSLFMTFISVVAAARFIDMPTIAWFTYVAGAVSARLFGAKVPEKIGPHRLVLPALLSYAIALFIASIAHTDLWFLSAGLFAGLAHGYCFPVLTSLVVSAVPQYFRGSALALFTGLWGFSAIVFAPLGGFLADSWGDQFMFLSMSIVVAILAIYLRPSRFTAYLTIANAT